MNKTNIDAIKMVRDIREKHYEEIKNKNHNEIIEYFRKKANIVNKQKHKIAGNLI